MRRKDMELVSTSATVRTVAPEDSAERWGNVGLPVLSTPAILGEVERLCDALMKPHLTDGQMTVGVEVVMRHSAPTRVGATVEFLVDAPRFDRKMEFAFRVVDGDGELVCQGSHQRAVIDALAFRRRFTASA